LRASAVGLRARAASLIARFIGTRATSLIVQFPEAQAEFDPEQARKREPVALSPDELNNGRKIHVEAGTPSPESLTAHQRPTQKIDPEA